MLDVKYHWHLQFCSLTLLEYNLISFQDDSNSVSQRIHEQGPASEHLERLIQVSSNMKEKEPEDPYPIRLSSILITPTPTISTIIDTAR